VAACAAALSWMLLDRFFSEEKKVSIGGIAALLNSSSLTINHFFLFNNQPTAVGAITGDY